MGLIFLDGFDDGLSSFKWNQFNGYNSGSRTGANAMALGTGNQFRSRIMLNSPDEHATIIVGFAYKMNGAQGTRIVKFMSDTFGTHHVVLLTTGANAIGVYRGDLSTLLGTTANNVLTPGSYQYLECKVVLHDTTGSVVIQINGVTVLNLTGIDTKNGGTKTVLDGLEFWADFQSASTFYDDLYVCNGAGSVNNDFLGDCTVQTLYPNGDGALSQWVGSDGNSTNNSLLVDETGVPNTTDYVESATPSPAGVTTATEAESLTFTGWTETTGGHGGSLIYASTPTSVLSFNVVVPAGNSGVLKFYGENPGSGSLVVYRFGIDGVTQDITKTGSGSVTEQSLLWTGPSMGAGTHAITVQGLSSASANAVFDYYELTTYATAIDTYAFTDLTGTNSVKGVVTRSYAAKSDSGAQLMRQIVRISGTNYPGSDDALGMSYASFTRIMETSPATSSAWTQAEVNGAEFGVEAR